MNLRINSLYTSAGGAVRLVVGILTAPLLIRLLGLEQFGTWAVLSAVVGIATQMEFGIPAAVNTLLAADIATGQRRVGNQTAATSMALTTLFGCVIAGALVFGAPLAIQLLFPTRAHDPLLTLVLRVLGISIPVRFWQSMGASLEGALLRYDLQTIIEMPSSLAIQIGSVVVAAMGGGILGIAFVQLGVTVATCAAHFAIIYRIWPTRHIPFSLSRESAGRLLRFGYAQWLTAMGAALFNQADRVIVNLTLGVVPTAIYSAVTSVANKIVEVTVLPLRVLPPAVSGASATGDMDRVRYLFGQAAKVNGGLSFVCAACLIFWADPVMTLIMGNAPAGAASALRVVSLIYAFNSICITSAWFVFGLARPAILARWALSGTFLMGVAIWVLGKAFGLPGAVWGNAAYLITIAITVELARLLQIPSGRAVMSFVPAFAAIGAVCAIASLPLYTHAPLVAQAIVFLVLTPLGVVSITGWRALCELVTSSLEIFGSVLFRQKGAAEPEGEPDPAGVKAEGGGL